MTTTVAPEAPLASTAADLASSDARARQSAAEALTAVDEPGLDALAHLLTDADPGVRRAAIEALVRLRKPGTTDRLRRLIEHPDLETRKAALEAALRVGSAGASSRSSLRRPSLTAPRVARMAATFGVGLLATGALGGLAALAYRFENTATIVLGGLLLFSVFLLAMKGWSWMSQYSFGSYGYAIKFLVLLFVMGTVVGLVPAVYWVGRGVGLLLDIPALSD